jgi:hypothetical protein
MDIRKIKPNQLTTNMTGFRPVVATGGIESIITVNNRRYKLHIFSTVGSDIFRVYDNGSEKSLEYLIVAGGGGGGMDMGGGGGGGGVLTGNYQLMPTEIISVTVGNGGFGGPSGGGGYRTDGTAGPQPNDHQFSISATNGGNSSFGTLTAIGGGYGGSSYYGYTPNYGAGATGGSGGGNSGYSDGNVKAAVAGTAGQGYRGGQGGGQYYSGGGGGAGGSGVDSTARPDGGPGRFSDILGYGLYWAGGGGGSAYSAGSGGHGGAGGGGGGAVGSSYGGFGYNNGHDGYGGGNNAQVNTRGGDAGSNTGGGGGGGSHYNRTNKGGEGGSGIVVVRYPIDPVKTTTVINRNDLILQLDASDPNSYPGSGTTWYDLSGNGNNYTILATAYNSSGPKYMDFNGSYGCAKKTDADLYVFGNVTVVCWTRIKNSTAEWRTLLRGASTFGDHQMIIQSGGWDIGMFDNKNGTGFNATGYSQQSLPGYGTTAWNMLIWRFDWSNSPYYALAYNNSPETIRGSNTSVNARFKSGVCSIGAYNNGVQTDPSNASQYWGDIGYISIHGRILSNSEILDIYNGTKARFGL